MTGVAEPDVDATASSIVMAMSKCSGHDCGSSPDVVVRHGATERPPLGELLSAINLQVAVGLERREVAADGRAGADSSDADEGGSGAHGRDRCRAAQLDEPGRVSP